MTTTCWFTCKRFGYNKLDFEVRDRPEGQSVAKWVKLTVLPALRGAHSVRAPLCTATKAAVFIPGRALGNKEFR